MIEKDSLIKLILLSGLVLTSVIGIAQNEVLTKVNGGSSWQIVADDGLGSIIDLSLSNTVLTLTDNVNSDFVDLITLRDGIGTDDQTVDEFSIDGVFLSLSLEGDNETTQVADLGSACDVQRFAETVDFPNIVAGGSAHIDISIDASTYAKIGLYHPIIFGMPTNIATENVDFDVELLTGPDRLRIYCFNHGSADIDLPSFELKGAALH